LRERKEAEIVQLPSTFCRIAKCVQSLLNDIGRNISQDSINYLRSCYSKPECPEIDYDRLAVPFAYAYFLENFYKSASTFLQEYPPLVRSVVDAGCGSGTTMLAYLAALEESLQEARWKIDVLLIDRSRTQLDLARKLFKHVQKEFHHLKIASRFQCMDLMRWEPHEQSIDAVLFGHVLNENSARVGSLLEKAYSALRSSGRIYIIERQNDTIWSTIDQVTSQLALPVKYGAVKLEASSKDLPLSRVSYKTHICTYYQVLCIPEQRQVVEALKHYMRAWKTRSLELLEDIFEPNADYYEKPFKPPLKGIERIKEYWAQKVLTQRDIQLRILNVAYAGNDVFAEWEARFVRLTKRKWVKGILILETDPETHRVAALREYYQSQEIKE